PLRGSQGLTREALPTGSDKTVMVHAMFDAIAPRYDLVNRLMTLGLDRGWRRRTLALLDLAPGSVVLDLACGTGDLLLGLRSGGYRALGADLSLGMLGAAHEGAGPLLQADGSALPLANGAIDGLVSGFALRNFTDLAGVLAEAARVIRPGGRISLLEVDTPDQPLVRLGHRLWFRGVAPRIGALLSDADAYRYLPRSVSYLPEPAALSFLMERSGFERIARHRLAGGAVQVLSATRAKRGEGTDSPAR
ncbi:MAG: menaquinone biosynthesis methyltransferase, partial [Acidimicrobiaceae bacterium]|nr:menaquinone biosynthesis methyltransferase [Acidimicrobiaceae bacterium]